MYINDGLGNKQKCFFFDPNTMTHFWGGVVDWVDWATQRYNFYRKLSGWVQIEIA